LKQMRTKRFGILLASSALFLAVEMPAAAHAQKKDASEAAQQFQANCAVCHGADASGDKGPALTTPNIVAKSDAALIKAVHDGTAAGMPPFPQLGDETIAALVHYLRKLQGQGETALTVTGDAAAGRTLYFGKAQCSSCHMIQGNGGFIAPDLTEYGRRHAAEAIRKAIVLPDARLAPDARVIEIQTKAGKKLTGVVRNEDNFNIALQTEDGRYHFLARNDLADVHDTGHSLMPQDYGTKLTDRELTDIVSFVIVTGQTHPAEPAPKRHNDDDD